MRIVVKLIIVSFFGCRILLFLCEHADREVSRFEEKGYFPDYKVMDIGTLLRAACF